MKNPGLRFPVFPKVDVAAVPNVVFRRKYVKPETRLPDQFAKGDLVLREICSVESFLPRTKQIDDILSASEKHHTAIHLRECIGNGRAPKFLSRYPVACMGMRSRNVITIEDVEHSRNVCDHSGIGVQIKGAVEASAVYVVHLRPAVGIVDNVDLVKDIGPRRGGISEQIDAQARGMFAHAFCRFDGGLPVNLASSYVNYAVRQFAFSRFKGFE